MCVLQWCAHTTTDRRTGSLCKKRTSILSDFAASLISSPHGGNVRRPASFLLTIVRPEPDDHTVAIGPSQHKGFHAYINITPSLHAELANRLQFLVGDDRHRVSLNRARMRTGLNKWNKLLENIGAKSRMVYTRISTPHPTDKTRSRIDMKIARLCFKFHMA